jgi:hypothetical protein
MKTKMSEDLTLLAEWWFDWENCAPIRVEASNYLMCIYGAERYLFDYERNRRIANNNSGWLCLLEAELAKDEEKDYYDPEKEPRFHPAHD